MRSNFNARLMEYGRIEKEMAAAGISGECRATIAKEKELAIRDAAEKLETPVEIQKRIAELQKKKQKVMMRLKEELRRIDEGAPSKEVPIHARRVSFRNRALFSEGRPIDIGTLLTDGEWGIAYVLDSTVPKHLRKQYATEEAKRKIRGLTDQQIIAEETTSGRALDALKQEAYQAVKERREEGGLSGGAIAEKMVRNFLRKMSLNTKLDFEIIPVDVYEDVEMKMDFVIRRRSRDRGVKVAASNRPASLGIQFTINTSEAAQQQKTRQVARSRSALQREGHSVNDIVLVTIPMDRVMQQYRTWDLKRGRPSGGPDELWDAQTKEQIFRHVLRGFFSDDELDARWEDTQKSQRSLDAAA